MIEIGLVVHLLLAMRCRQSRKLVQVLRWAVAITYVFAFVATASTWLPWTCAITLPLSIPAVHALTPCILYCLYRNNSSTQMQMPLEGLSDSLQVHETNFCAFCRQAACSIFVRITTGYRIGFGL